MVILGFLICTTLFEHYNKHFTNQSIYFLKAAGQFSTCLVGTNPGSLCQTVKTEKKCLPAFIYVTKTVGSGIFSLQTSFTILKLTRILLYFQQPFFSLSFPKFLELLLVSFW